MTRDTVNAGRAYIDQCHVRRKAIRELDRGEPVVRGFSNALLGRPKTIATLLGHADMQSSEPYTHGQVDATRAMLERSGSR